MQWIDHLFCFCMYEFLATVYKSLSLYQSKAFLYSCQNLGPPAPQFRRSCVFRRSSSFFLFFISIFFFSLFVFRWSQKSSINTPSIALYCWKMSPLRMLENTRSLLETTLESPMRQSASISTVSIISCSLDTTTNSKTMNLNFHVFFWPIWRSFTDLVCLFVIVFLSETIWFEKIQDL